MASVKFEYISSTGRKSRCLISRGTEIGLRPWFWEILEMAGQTLFEKYGGFSNVSKVVLSFYDTLLDSDEIGPFFDDVDMSRMVDHQTKFVASLLGGPASYTDNQLRQLHSHIDIQNGHFDELKDVLAATLRNHAFEPEDVKAVLTEFETRRTLIVS